MRLVAVAAAITCASATLAQVLPAQWRADAELGAGWITQPDAQDRSAATARGSVAWVHETLALLGSGGVTLPSTGARRAQGEVAASFRSDPRRALGLEASGIVSAYDERRFPTTVSGFAGVRMHARARGVGLWGGAMAGTLDDGTYTYPHTMIEAGAATAWRLVRFGAAATHNRTLGEPRIEFVGDPPLQVTMRDRLRYTDAAVTVQARPRDVDVDARIVQRHVHRTIAYEELPPSRLFGAASVAWWVRPGVAVAGSIGHELADLARGLPEARYATLGLRVRLNGASPGRPLPAARRAVPTGAAPDVLIERGGDSSVRLRVLASPGAREIEVAGTFTAWDVVRLRDDGGGAWSLGTPLESGQHRVMVRVDGGEWMPPANLPSVDDELGGRVGIFTVL